MFLFTIAYTLLTPLIMILIGLIWRRHPPKTMNGVYGYRTNSSMKNQETWDYAHTACSKVWVILGSLVLLISLIFCVLYTEVSVTQMENLSIIVVIFQCISLVLSIVPVEIMIKRKFR